MNEEILNRYLNKQCSKEELELLQEWLKENPANEDFFCSFIESREEEVPNDINPDAREAWQKFKNRHIISKVDKLNRFSGADKKTVLDTTWGSHYLRRGWASAAFVMLLLSLTGIFLLKYDVFGVSKDRNQVTYKTISTQKGQRTTLRLKDGTKVMLNAASQLRIPSNYDKVSRKIYLKGEAFFKVSHDKASPFVVIAQHKFIKDIGTQFNVSTYDSTQIKVAVKEGVVSIGRMKHDKLQPEISKLYKKKLGVLTGNNLKITTIKDMNVFTGWTEEKLVFQDTPLAEVIRQLNRVFDVKGKIADRKISSRTLSATYDYSKMPFDEILNVLSLSLHITYTQHKNTIVFKDK